MTLRGRKIGLHACMTKEKMKQQLLKIMEDWQKEGFSKIEVIDAVIRKCRPLTSGFYWRKYEEAQKILQEVLSEMQINEVKI